MQIGRRGAERNRGLKSAEIRRSDFRIFDFGGHGIVELELTPKTGFDPDSTHVYQILMRVDEFANMIEELNCSASMIRLGEESSSSIKRLAESLRALAETLERTS